MSSASIKEIQHLFTTRLDTLAHLLRRGFEELNESSMLQRRLAPDMFPLGTQVVFTCNQPRNFALWAQGRPRGDLDLQVASLEQANTCIQETKDLLSATPEDDPKLAELIRIELGPTLYAEMSGIDYVNEFLVPNFYFHLVTAYGILRSAGLDIGKQDYMRHLAPFVKQA
ncbi:DUF1993 domain-containing protein [Gilvimarinus sp. F26214L]|uniref:DUF1993 domain-containing protein n=1 Tax=Gilvimarinus sp. DZF01 TaxID=3461371 RepID=UPI00404624CC